MAVTELEDVVNQISTVWSPLYTDELRNSQVLVNLIDKTHEADFNQGNDTARISQYDAGTGQDLIVSRVKATDTACDFSPSIQTMSHVDLLIDRRAVSSREFCDTVELLSKVDPSSDKLRQAMAYEAGEVINNRLYSLVAPTVALTEATLSATVLTSLGAQADEANWPTNERYLLVTPGYYEDLLNAQTLVSADSVGSSDRPQIAGRFMQERFGWKIIMDNSAGLKSITTTPATDKGAIAFIPEFMHWASPRSQFKFSDMHPSLKFGSVMSFDSVYGAVQGIGGADKVISIKSA